jgi:uncharacterized membrane protein
MRTSTTTTSATTSFTPTPVGPAKAGLLFFAAALLGTGLQHLIAQDFVTRMFRMDAGSQPGRPVLACLLGLLLIGIAAAFALGKRARAAALVLAALFLLSILFLHVPSIAANPGMGGVWTNPAKVVVFFATALLVAALSASGAPAETDGRSLEDRRLRRAHVLAKLLFSGFLILCGVQHYVYSDFVATLVPGWVPGHTFWTYFTGTALVAGGVGLLVPKTARWAALLTALMIFSWFVLLHIPLALAAPHEPMEWAGVCESLAMSGVALLLAGTLPRGSARVPAEQRPPASGVTAS